MSECVDRVLTTLTKLSLSLRLITSSRKFSSSELLVFSEELGGGADFLCVVAAADL